jgi:hypothetical protein
MVITEMMVTRTLAGIGAMAIANRTIVPVAAFVGSKVGRMVGNLANKQDKNGQKNTKKGKVYVDQAKEQAILDLLAECDKALAEDNKTEEPGLTIVKEESPEPKFNQHMQDWIRKVQEQYGGFEKIVLD